MDRLAGLMGSTVTATQTHSDTVNQQAAAAQFAPGASEYFDGDGLADYQDMMGQDAANMQQLSDFQTQLPGMLEQQAKDLAGVQHFLSSIPQDHPMNIQSPSVWTEWAQPFPSTVVYMDPIGTGSSQDGVKLAASNDGLASDSSHVSHGAGANPVPFGTYTQFDLDPLLNRVVHL